MSEMFSQADFSSTERAEAAAVPGNEGTHSAGGSLAESLAAPSCEVRMERVAALRAALENGTYGVPTGDVADKLIETLLEE